MILIFLIEKVQVIKIIYYIKLYSNLAFMKIRTKSCDAKRKGVPRNNIERNRLALADALNINKEVK